MSLNHVLGSAREAKSLGKYRKALQCIDVEWEYIPFYMRNKHNNEFLLERADCYWHMKDYSKCLSILSEVHSNRLPILCGCPHIHKKIYDTWMSRGKELLDTQPSFAKLFFEWSLLHAITIHDRWNCLLLNGVATCLSGDQFEGQKLILKVKWDAYFNGYDIMEEAILYWKAKGINALEEGRLMDSKHFLQTALILVDNGTNDESRDKLRHSIESCQVSVHFKLNEHQEALKLGKKLYAAEPIPSYKEAMRWQEFGQILLCKGRTDLVPQCLTLALDYAPQVNKRLRFNLVRQRSQIHHKTFNPKEALKDAENAISILPDDVEGYKCLVACYKTLDNSKTLSALNQCLRTEYNSHTKLRFLKDAISIAVKLEEATTTITTKVPKRLIKQLQEEAIQSRDWEVLRVLYLGGGGPHKFQVGEGGLATGVRAEEVATEDAVASNFSKKPETLAALLTHGAPVDGLTDGANPLMHAVSNGDLEIVKVLLDYDANLCVQYENGSPVVHDVVQNAIRTGNFQMIQVLLGSGHSDIENIQDSKGNTVYHLCTSGKITNNKCKVIRLLLNANVDPTIPNKQGRRPIDYLKKNDDRRRMLERFLRVRNKAAEASCLLFPVGKLKVEGNRPYRTNLCQITRSNATMQGKCLLAKNQGSRLQQTNSTKVELRNYLEKLIESVTVVEDDIDESDDSEEEEEEEEEEEIGESNFDEFVNFVGDEEVAYFEVPDNGESLNVKSTEDKTSETNDSTRKDVDDIEIENLEWEVDFSGKFLKSFRNKKMQPEMRRKIIEKIRMLAQGRWSKKLCKRLEGEAKKKGILLYESKLTKSARILWEKTIAFSQRNSSDPKLMLEPGGQGVLYSDIIRIWEVVLDHGNLEREIQNVVRSIVKSHERGWRCIIRKNLKGIGNGMPSKRKSRLSFPSSYQEISGSSSLVERKKICYPPASSEENEFNILKFHPFTSAIIESLLDRNDVKSDISIPFKVTELEHAIINLKPDPPCPIILLGRSGTGKTICCLYRLWNEFQNYWEKAITAGPLMLRYAISATTSGKQESSENCQASSSVSITEKDATAKPMEQSLQVHHEHFHQLFITKNHVLCSEAKKNFKDLKYSCSATKSMTMMCKDSLPNRIQDVGDTSWPLFIGARDWLRLLDASLPGETFFKRAEDGSLLERIVGWGEDDTHLISIPDKDEDDDDENDDDDDDDTKGHRDEDDEDYGDDNDDDHNNIGNEEGENTTARKDHRRKTKAKKGKNVPKEVTYEVFRDELWPNIKKGKKVEYHPSLVWTEIKSFIKGSVEAMKTNSGFLSFKEYQELGRKRSTNFMEDRGTLYEMFETYERLRTSKGMFDEADLVYQLHRRLSDNPDLQWSIHSVYVDETQDFTQAELSLLIRCCRFQNRMFFTGDTAQSIVRGIAFRFEDLKALFHDIMSLDKTKSVEPVRTPDRLYQLTYNYRSHSGILKLASSVLNMLLYFFPESTDKLEEDHGLFDGPKPVLLESCRSSDMVRILKACKRRTSRIEFGAHQAVLVVSEEARNNMPEELKHGLVLTIYEAKGLEFDDVLIYNFFTDSQAKKEWKIAASDIDLKHIETQCGSSTGIVELKDGDHKFKTKGTHFEASKHNILISELKFLYTAVTRARVNVWFFDEDEDARGPMYEYFQRLGLVRTDIFESASMLEFDLESLEEQSLSQDDKLFESEEKALEKTAAKRWRDQGMVYYNKGLWLVAQKCFSFAEDEDMTRKSRVQQTAQDALKQRHSPRKMKEMLRSAAIGFLELHMVEKAALCLHNARERVLLAKLNMKMEKFSDASKLFQSVGRYDEASKCMERLNNYSQAIEILCEARLFAKAIEVFERYNSLKEGKALQKKDIVPPAPNRSTKQLCFEAAEAYLNDGKRKEMDAVLKRYSSTHERISFLKRKLCFKEAAGALVENNRKQEATQFLQLHGRFREAIKYSHDDKFLADCYLYEARSLNKRILCANYHEDVVQHLESAIKCYHRCRNQNGKAEALLFLGCQNDDPRLISESGKIFKERLNVCGESDAVEEWLKRKSLTHCHCETAVKAIEKLLDLIISLHKRHARLSAVQRTKIARCEEYFGLEQVCDTRKRCYHTNFYERFDQIAPRDWLQGERANVQTEVEVEKAHQAIALHLFAKANSLNQTVTSFFRSKLKLKSIDGSHLVTDLPFNEKFEILFNWVFLDGAITKFFSLLKQFVSSPVLFEAEKVLPQELELFLPCKLFAELLFPEAGYKVQHPTAEQIQKIKKYPAVKRRLIQYCNHQWKSSGTASARVLQTMRLLSVEQVINERGIAKATTAQE